MKRKARIKRILCLLIAAVLCVPMIVPVFAAPSGTVTLESKSITADASSVSLKIVFKNNPELIHMQLTLAYDSDHFTLISVTDGGVFKNHQFSDVSQNPCVLALFDDLSSANTLADGTLATLTFAMKPGTPKGDYAFTLSCSDTYNRDFANVSVSAVNGTVSVGCAHEFGAWSTVTGATMETEGLEKRVCALCHREETRVIPRLGEAHTHSFTGDSEIIKEASCYATGILRTYCRVAGCHEYQDIPLPMTAHSPGEFQVTVEATCSTKGVRVQSCRVCGKMIRTEEIPAKTHNYQEVTIAPGCYVAGYTIRSCTNCGSAEKIKDIPAIGYHTVSEWTVIRPATQTTAGEMIGVCTHCKKKLTVTAPPLTDAVSGDGATIKSETLLPGGTKISLQDVTAEEAFSEEKEAISGQLIGLWHLTVSEENTAKDGETVRTESAGTERLTVSVSAPAGLTDYANLHLLLIRNGSAEEASFRDNGDGTVSFVMPETGLFAFTATEPQTPTAEPTAAPTDAPGQSSTISQKTVILLVLLAAVLLAIVLLALLIARKARR